MATAKLIKHMESWRGDARHYRLTPPLGEYGNVVVSAVDIPFCGEETYIFGCDENAENINYCELNGSFRGGLDHEKALRDAGYEVQ